MNEIITSNSQEAVIKYYKPSELLGMFTAYLSRQDVNSQVIYLRGIYLKNVKHDPRWSYRELYALVLGQQCLRCGLLCVQGLFRYGYKQGRV